MRTRVAFDGTAADSSVGPGRRRLRHAAVWVAVLGLGAVAACGAGANPVRAITTALAAAVSGTSVVIDVHTGHGESLQAATNKAAPDKNDQVELSLMVKGSTPVDIRVVNQTVFLKVDLAQLLPLYGQDAKQA